MSIVSFTIVGYIVAAIAIICTSLLLYLRHAYQYWARLGVPYIEPHFFYGNTEKTLKLQKHIGQEVLEWYNYSKAKGHKYVGIYSLGQASLVMIDPELIKCVMSKDFDHFVDRGAFYNEESDPLSAHLFSLEGTRWKHLRQKLTPTFTTGKLKKMFQTLVDCTEELKSCLDDFAAKNEPVNIKKILTQYTTDVIGSCAFGIDCNSFKNPDSDFTRLGQKIFSPDFLDRMKMLFSVMLPSVSKFLGLRVTNKEVDRFFRKLVRDTVEYREKNNVTRNDFMHLLMQLKNQGKIDDEEDSQKKNPSETLTMDEISAQAFIFFLAGFETSSTTMTFCLHELSKNQDVQEKARENIMHVLEKHDGKITYESIMEMHYLERVILETLRIKSPLPILQRIVTKDYKIPETDIVLKEKTVIFIPVEGLQSDPEYYREPEKFDPDRFTEENKATRPDFTFLPFGDGPRICIGQRFGMMQTKVGLCRLLSNYRFTLNPKTDDPLILDPNSFVLCAKNGVWLNAQRI